MSKKHIPQIYFCLFSLILAIFNWSTPPINWLFLAFVVALIWQFIYPRKVLEMALIGVAICFALGHAGSIIRILTDDFTPFRTDTAWISFGTNSILAMINFLMILYWLKNGFDRSACLQPLRKFI